MSNANQPAMPVPGLMEDPDFNGLTKREYIAARMMQANRTRTSDYKSWHDMAKDAVEATDALLAELERTGGNDG